jgi:glycosyltransferase involved in cell wall biosynthesis
LAYNYVDFSNTQPQISHNLANQINNPFLLAIAQHRKNKNLDILIKAFQLLLDKKQLHEKTKLVLVGSPGSETDNLKQLIHTLNLDKKILILSDIGDKELCWLYQHSEMLIVPSSTEGFCFPLAEALYFSSK